MPLLANINVGSAPNDGTGANLRSAFITVNENFQFIETFFPNTDVANLTANITSAGSTITATGTTSYTYNGLAQGPATSTVTGSTDSQKIKIVGSDYLEEKDTFFKDNTMTQSIVCNDCEHSWNEIWTFNRIEEK